MSKKSSRLIKSSFAEKRSNSPSILKKKRKFENVSENQPPKTEEMEGNECFTQSYHGERLLAAHPLLRPSPIPEVSWGDSDEIWKNLIQREMSYPHDHMYFQKHPELKPKMRAILLDWLIEVCEVYRLHRETFYLSQDLIDRFLSLQQDAKKDRLQLIGITCLFIASKVEEIYPPKLTEFAYVTDGACTDKEILQQELIILMTLGWNVTPVTITTWLSTFLQVAAYQKDTNQNFEVCNFDGEVFSKLCQVLDLCILDINCLQFSYGVLAASVIIHFISEDVGLTVSGFKKVDVDECIEWMRPFIEAIAEHEMPHQKYFDNIADCDMHNIQTHDIGLKLLEQVRFKQSTQASDETIKDLNEIGILTPPQSSKKLCLRRVTP